MSRSMLVQHDGPLTRELLLAPGRFGLGRVPDRVQPDATVTSVCGYCSTGCGLNIHMRDGEAVNLTPVTPYPVNLGMACPKGWESLSVLDAADRATVPLRRDRNGRPEPIDWPTAMNLFCRRMKAVQKRHGPESVAFLSTGQIPTEEMALLGSLAKFGMGIRHGDGNTRQCMASAVVAYKQAFGFDAPPYTYADFEESDVLVFVGANPCLAHPIMWERVMRSTRSPEIVVVDPRMTETAMNATLHLPVQPKSDMALFYGLARLLMERGAVDEGFVERHTAGFDGFRSFVAGYTVERTAALTGLSPDAIRRFAEIVAGGGRVSFWWTMGVNQSYQGVRTAQAIINVALMTGNIGRPGTGANSITGQCNAMGSRLFSNTTSLLGGHDFGSAADRRKVADVLKMDEALIPHEASWAYPEIIEGILRGSIRGLWVICTNPSHSWIHQNQCRDILDRLDFLVVQDMYHSTETAQQADLILPAAGWGEKEGTFINSERRIGRIRKVKRAPGQALSDFSIFRLIAQAWGCEDLFREWTSPEAVFQILKRLSAGQPCDFTGIRDYDMLDECGGIQWPYPAGDAPPAAPSGETGGVDTGTGTGTVTVTGPGPESSERRLFSDGRFCHPDGRARFLFEEPRPLSEAPGENFPLILITGRGSASQWHTQTRTGKSSVLKKLYPQNVYVELNPADARQLNIAHHERVEVVSQRGRLQARAFLTPTVQAGQVFIPMHYVEANRLTDAVFDPYSRQPSYKACAVAVRRV